MIRNLAIILAVGCLLATPPAFPETVCESCSMQDRGDRLEGVDDREQVSGGSFELQSVHYLRPGEAKTPSPNLHLYFWLPEERELEEIKVAQPARYYRMEPKRKQYPQGLQVFSWPRGEVIEPLGLSVDALYARVKDDDTFIPALVSTRETPAPQGGYAFVFESGAGIDADCTVARQDGTEVKTFECFEDYGGMITIEWDGKDGAGQPAADGLYVLEIEGDMLAETIRPLATTVAFRHQARLK